MFAVLTYIGAIVAANLSVAAFGPWVFAHQRIPADRPRPGSCATGFIDRWGGLSGGRACWLAMIPAAGA